MTYVEYRTTAQAVRKGWKSNVEALPVRKDGKLPTIVIRFTLDQSKP